MIIGYLCVVVDRLGDDLLTLVQQAENMAVETDMHILVSQFGSEVEFIVDGLDLGEVQHKAGDQTGLAGKDGPKTKMQGEESGMS